MKFVPRDYQQIAIDWIKTHPRCALFLQPGLGKTSSVLATLDEFPVLVVAPLRVAQTTWPDEVAKWNFPYRVSVITGNVKQRLASLNAPAHIYTINYENLPWLVETVGNKWPFKIVVADECFVEGTVISTPKGPSNIETLNVGDIVETHLGPKKIIRLYKHYANTLNLVSVKLSNGIVIHATYNHPFYTDQGWLPAGACGGRKLFSFNDLSNLQKQVYEEQDKSKGTMPQRQNSVLHTFMPNKGDFYGKSDIEKKRFCFDEKKYCGQNGHKLEQWKKFFRRSPAEDVDCSKKEDCKVFSYSRGKRVRYVSNGEIGIRSYSGGFLLQLYHFFEGFSERLSLTLQIGFWKSNFKNLFGGGRAYPRFDTWENQGSKENRGIDVVGVESFQDTKRRGSVFVYNLEVEDAHTYFANGILVHNCTRLKSFRLRQGGKQAKALARVAFTLVKRFIGLTGTPSPKNLTDLWGQLWFIDKGERLGRSFSAFTDKYFTVGYDGFSLELKDGSRDKILASISDVCLSIDPNRYFRTDIPIQTDVLIDLPDKARRLYREMEREMYIQIGEEGIEAFNAATRIGKSLQICNGFAYDESKTAHIIHDEKLKALEEIVNETPSPILVSYQFKADLERLLKHFPKGRHLDKDPKTIEQWNAGEIPLLFAHPASAGHGLSLQHGSNVLVYFSHGWNLEHHQQIIERIGPARQKQSGYDRPVYVYSLIAKDTVEEDVVQRLQGKASEQEILLRFLTRSKNMVDK